MAKETAHQLGTPISSIMGWLDLLKNDSENRNEAIEQLEYETNHLKNISEKFNKIGSKPKLKKIILNEVLEDLIIYYKKRIPKSKKINIKLSFLESYVIKGDYILLYWSFENLIKNSIESIKNGEGIIDLSASKYDDKIKVYVNDNGIGILPKDKSQIFKPGYSTKSRVGD